MTLSFSEYLSLPHVFVDVDGVIADFKGSMSRFYPECSTNAELNNWLYEHDGWDYLEQENPHVYGKLDVLPDASELMSNLITLRTRKKIRLSMLTAIPKLWADNPTMSEIATNDKKEWVRRRFGIPTDATLVVRREEKQYRVAEENRIGSPTPVLIDDLDKNITEWKSAGGHGILHTSARSSLVALSKYLNGGF